LKDVHIYSLAINGNNIFAGGGDGVYLSTNNGSSWNHLSFGSWVWDMAIHENNIFVSSSGGAISLSTDNGSSWNNIFIPSPVAYGDALTINDENIFVATSSGVYLSTDNGSNWNAVNNGLPTHTDITSLSNNGNKIFAGTRRGVWCSSDNGVSWEATNNGFIIPQVLSIVNCENNVIAATNYGIYFSSDNGNNWITSNDSNGWGTSLSGVSTLSFSGNNMVAETVTGIFISSDNGTNWNAVNGWPGGNLLAISVSGNNIFAGTTGGIYLSTNNGSSWNLINNGLPDKSVYTYAISGNNFLAGYYDGDGVYLSTNNGSSWNKVLASPRVTSLAVSGNNIFAGTSGGVYLSTDNGLNWIAVGDIDFVDAFVFSGNNIFAANGGVYLSTNDGSSWIAVNDGFPARRQIYTVSIIANDIYAGAFEGSGVWRRPLSEMITDVRDKQNNMPTHFALEQNYPNPFNPVTTISFSLPSKSFVSLKVFDLIGREVATLVNEELSSGTHSRQWNAAALPSGIYFYQLQAGNFTETRKLVLLR
jgi:hypothetical protein